MIVDDVLLHVGSANLNNRSIGLDTECDLAIEARTQGERSAIERLRNRLLGHHCGLTADAVAASLTQTGSLVRTALTLRAAGHYLAPVTDAAVPAPPPSRLESLADRDGPIPPPRFLETIVGERPKARPLRRLTQVIAAGAVIVALMLAWRFTPLASLARPDTMRQWLAAIAQAPAAPLPKAEKPLVIGVIGAGGRGTKPAVDQCLHGGTRGGGARFAEDAGQTAARRQAGLAARSERCQHLAHGVGHGRLQLLEAQGQLPDALKGFRGLPEAGAPQLG